MATGKRKRRRIVIGVALAVLVLAGLGLWLWAELRYRMNMAYHTPGLAGALYWYHAEHRELPEKLETVEATGLYGRTPYRLPRGRWEALMGDYTGPRPVYLPVRDWDGNTPFIIALGAFIGRSGGRGYVKIGDTRGYFATREELELLLAEDDRAREAKGQPGRWRDVDWRREAGD
jgi:hypothetical protein